MKQFKKIMITAILAIITGAGLTAYAQAGLIDSMLNSGNKTVNSTTVYNLESYGWDSRVVEWTPAMNKNVRCVFVASNKSSGVACYYINK